MLHSGTWRRTFSSLVNFCMVYHTIRILRLEIIYLKKKFQNIKTNYMKYRKSAIRKSILFHFRVLFRCKIITIHNTIYMLSNKIHKVFYDWVLFITYVSSTCFGPHPMSHGISYRWHHKKIYFYPNWIFLLSLGGIAPDAEFHNYAPCEGSDRRRQPSSTQRHCTGQFYNQWTFHRKI